MIDIDHYFDSPSDICKMIADREKKHRRLLKISQKTLADMTGVSFGSIRRFEEKGQISFESLVRIAIALDLKEDIKKLFIERKVYKSIQDVIDEANQER